ncbi:MAG: beta-lactamase family protein [Sphingopyxis sp.]|nr:beta-lactamase family protein [Sphingopyxis sp.]
MTTMCVSAANWRKALLFVIAIYCSVMAGTSSAQGNARELTRSDAEAWLDGFFPALLARDQIAGAAVVIVKDGQILTQRGYGFADVAAERRVDPANTMFRIGSISKLFTWTAVMQLSEQGRLDLDRDINGYLDFNIPSYAGRPITMRQLMQHSGGFEDNYKYLIIDHPEDRRLTFGLQRYVKDWTPTRVYAPGATTTYSNYGTALAGYIVQRVSGLPFETYVERNIFGPLAMAHSTFQQPVPAQLRPFLAHGYDTMRGERQSFEFVPPTSAGSASASATDMGQFLIAHLQRGRFGNNQLLRPGTAALMQDSDLRRTAHLPGFALGFYRMDRPGLRVIGHGGDTQFAHADMMLFQDKGVGYFVVINSSGNARWRETFFDEFVRRYFPAAASAPTRFRPRPDHAEAIAGVYHTNRRSISGPMAFVNLLGQFEVVVNPDGTVTGIAGVDDPGGTKWREVDDYLWQEVGGSRRFAAAVDGGRVSHIQLGWIPPVLLFEKVPAAQNGTLNIIIVVGALLILLVAIGNWIARPLVRRAYGISTNPEWPRSISVVRRLIMFCAVAAVIGTVLMLFVMTIAGGVLDPVSSTIDYLLLAAQACFWLAAFGGAITPVLMVSVARHNRRAYWTLIKLALLGLAFAGITWFTATNNLLSFRLDF